MTTDQPKMLHTCMLQRYFYHKKTGRNEEEEIEEGEKVVIK